MKISATDASRQPAAPKPIATPSPEAAPVIARDRLTVSRHAAANAGASAADFSWQDAGRHWWTGFIKQPKAVFESLRDHPWRTLGMVAAAGAAIALVPLALPISIPALGAAMTVAFGGWGAVNMALGGLTAWRAHQDGRFEQAEQEFERIGEGSFNLASAVMPYVTRQVGKLVRSGVTSEAAFAGRLTEGAEIVATKADGLHRAARSVSQAGKAAEAETLLGAAKQLQTYEQILKQQAGALAEGRQTIAQARAAIQHATREMQRSAATPALSPLRLSHSAAKFTWAQKASTEAVGTYKALKSSRKLAGRAETLKKAMKVKKFIKTVKLFRALKPIKALKPLIGVVPAEPVATAAPTPPSQPAAKR